MLELLKKSFSYRIDAVRNSESIVRLCAGAADLLPGLLVDKFGRLIVATLYAPELSAAAQSVLSCCTDCFPDHFVIIRIRDNSLENSYRLLYNNPEIPSAITAEENGLKYEIHFDARHDFGIFRDAAAARLFVSENCKGKRVLNLFAYTCAFGVTAAYYGASSVTNVDPNKDYLTWGKKNAKLNQVDFGVIPDTSQKYLARQVKKKQNTDSKPYDMIITDPPAFGVGRGSDRTLRNYWPVMLNQLAYLEPDQILLLCNDRSVKGSGLLTRLLGEQLPDYRQEKISHLPDVLGAQQKNTDRWYQLPEIILLSK